MLIKGSYSGPFIFWGNAELLIISLPGLLNIGKPTVTGVSNP